VGLLYQQGYFRQVIDRNGEQQALFPYNDPGQLPISVSRIIGNLLFQLRIAAIYCAEAILQSQTAWRTQTSAISR
jgi:glucan phosphorylase